MSQRRKSYRRIAVAVLALTTLSGPSAFAQPIGGGTHDARQLDMHASTVVPPPVVHVYRDASAPDAVVVSPAAKTPVYQDLRSPDAIAQSPAPKGQNAHQDLRTPDAIAQSPAPQAGVIAGGPPAFPTVTDPLSKAAAPKAAASNDGDDGIGLVVPGIALALVLAGGAAFAVARTRTGGTARPAH